MLHVRKPFELYIEVVGDCYTVGLYETSVPLSGINSYTRPEVIRPKALKATLCTV